MSKNLKDLSQKMLKCKINNVDMEVAEGTSVIEAIKSLNQDIAHYCWHPGLSVAGVCRLCMVDIEGQNKLQIACNTKVQAGMVASNQSDKVKDAVRWGLEFHLINHPLDCPICDQAGECALQDQYMKFGTYTPTMSKRKVKKRKVVDLGSKIVLDTERCILCSRCVRFTDEVTKTHELGIFNRGDRSEIGVFKDKPLDNDYAVNTVDICPVGALTSKDFRFKQRVWYTKTADSVCTGCSTGCNTHVDYNEEGLWRVRPRYNSQINNFWMCDKGRGLYQHANRKNRMTQAFVVNKGQWESATSLEVISQLSLVLQPSRSQLLESSRPVKPTSSQPVKLSSSKSSSFSKMAFVLTGQYSNEEYQFLAKSFPKSSYYHWLNNKQDLESFDGLLLRGDKNPNTAGLKSNFPKLKTWNDFEKNFSNYECVVVLGPENKNFYPDLKSVSDNIFSKCKKLVWLAADFNKFLKQENDCWQIPMKSCFEKTGQYTNFKGVEQKINKIQTLAPQALSVIEFIQVLKGEHPDLKVTYPYFKQNQFLDRKEKLW